MAPQIEDIWAKNWAKIILAGNAAEFESHYRSLIDRLLASDWKKVVAEKQEAWDEFLKNNPLFAKIKNYHTVTPIAEVDREL